MTNLINFSTEIVKKYIIQKKLYDLLIKFKWTLKYKFPSFFQTPNLNNLISMSHRKFFVQESIIEKYLKSVFEYACGYSPN